jgi:hypothetical protein
MRLGNSIHQRQPALTGSIRRAARVSMAVAISAAASSTWAASARAATTLVDNFESATAPAPWRFSNGAEYPGAVGSISGVTSTAGKRLAINYDLSKGGAYVAATRALLAPVPAVALRFGAVVPADAKLGIRVRDATGQWLNYKVTRPVTARDEKDWFRAVVELGPSSSYWGGANDGVAHSPINTIWFTVAAAGGTMKGSVGIDQIEALDTLNVNCGLGQAPVSPVPGLTNLMDGLGAATMHTSDAVGLDAVRSAGLTWVKTTMLWDQVERQPGVYDFSKWDRLVTLLSARGMKASFVLAYHNPLYGSGPPIAAPASTAFVAYAKAAAKHFAGRPVRFEVWNEPDGTKFWRTPDPVAYARFATPVVDAVHAGNPTAKVATGGISWFDFAYLNPMLAAGGATRADGISIHPYRGTAAPETLVDEVTRARKVIASSVSTNPQIWDTEWGYTTTQFGMGDAPEARKRHAVMAVRRMVAARLVGFPIAIWYNLRDDGTDPAAGQHNFGLITAAGADKPAMTAIRTLNRAAQGRTLAGSLNLAQPLVNALRLDGANDTVWMLWSTSRSRDVQIGVQKPIRAMDMLGAALPLATAYTLREANGPIYLTYSRPTSLAMTTTAYSEADLELAAHGDGSSEDLGPSLPEPGIEAPRTGDTPEPGELGEAMSTAPGCQIGGGYRGRGAAALSAIVLGALLSRRRRRARSERA